jgi:hypothetical protein
LTTAALLAELNLKAGKAAPARSTKNWTASDWMSAWGERGSSAGGADGAFLALAIAGLTSQDGLLVQGAYLGRSLSGTSSSR